ncbi:alpha-galactosidase [Clohesyomyces aquaticus]|uniref:Alpha-galactosidase n=1 Tax=Clohesyomyces aquaticus TaxID=1231657 RepID=A0A1Y1ZN60_9PLEO|nr:alpha-galactosidase [Clohesyomyces aquaticus]
MVSSTLFTCILTSAVLGQVGSAKPLAKRLDNGLGKTPALGWNTWNAGQCNFATAAKALQAADLFDSLGLKALGYNYINIDDCWSNKARNSSGYLVADPARWPNGMKAVADSLHAKGLKLGLYGDSGTQTCAGYPGSQGYEDKDAKTLASWGVDYWKYDNCATPGGNSQPRYEKMRDTLLSSGRPIFYSLCNWGRDNVWTWGGKVGNSWRITDDNFNSWSYVASIAARGATIAQYGVPGGFNDWDMMQISNGKLNAGEERAHMGLWAIGKSPILLGMDLSKISSSSLAIVKNKALLAINQDPLGKPATTFRPSGAAAPSASALYPYWAGPLSDGVVIGLVAADSAATLTVKFADVPGLGAGTFSWTEVYSGKTGSGTSVSAQLALHDMAVFKVVK